MKGKTAIDLAKTETTLTLLCPLHYCAARGMLDNLVAEVAKVCVCDGWLCVCCFLLFFFCFGKPKPCSLL